MGGVSNRPERGAVSERSVEACCGEFGGEGCRRLIGQSRVRPCGVIVIDPCGNDPPGMIEPEEQRLVQQLVRQ